MFCVGIEKAGPAQRGEKQSGGLFFRPWEIPRIPERSPQDCETESDSFFAFLHYIRPDVILSD